jgi:YVTN family beta-propeller protein
MSGFHCKIRLFNTLIAALIVILFSGCKKGLVTIYEPTTDNKMFVYPNKGNTFYLVDYKTNEFIREIKLNVPVGIYLLGMYLSTNRDHLIFSADDTANNHQEVFITYDINNDKTDNIYYTGLFNGAVPRVIAGQNQAYPGWIYVNYRDLGLYLIDVFENKIVKQISSEHDFTFEKWLYHSPDGRWDIIVKAFNVLGYTEIELYTANTDYADLQFILNKDNKDSVDAYYVGGLAFSSDNRLFVSYQPSGGKPNTAGYIGVYDLNTLKFNPKLLTFPWSLNGYNIAYNSSHNELYDVGNRGIFYIIDDDKHTIKRTIDLSVQGQESPIVLSPDKNTVYVAFSDNDKLFVIDLPNWQVIKTISLNHPYKIIIP